MFSLQGVNGLLIKPQRTSKYHHFRFFSAGTSMTNFTPILQYHPVIFLHHHIRHSPAKYMCFTLHLRHSVLLVTTAVLVKCAVNTSEPRHHGEKRLRVMIVFSSTLVQTRVYMGLKSLVFFSSSLSGIKIKNTHRHSSSGFLLLTPNLMTRRACILCSLTLQIPVIHAWRLSMLILSLGQFTFCLFTETTSLSHAISPCIRHSILSNFSMSTSSWTITHLKFYRE